MCHFSSQQTYPQGLRRPLMALCLLFSDTAEGSPVPNSQEMPHSPYDLSFVKYLATHLKNTQDISKNNGQQKNMVSVWWCKGYLPTFRRLMTKLGSLYICSSSSLLSTLHCLRYGIIREGSIVLMRSILWSSSCIQHSSSSSNSPALGPSAIACVVVCGCFYLYFLTKTGNG